VAGAAGDLPPLALTDESGKRFRFDDKAERQALDLAGADSTRYLVWVGDDYAGLEADRSTHRLVGHAPEFALDLELTPERPPVIHGRDGVSQKSAGLGNASHYYSFTRLATRGRLVLGADTLAVEGLSWMDHEFGSDQMRNTHTGWDWFSVQLADGRDLMLYRLRTVDGHGRLVLVRHADRGRWQHAHAGAATSSTPARWASG
jgi:predicted secreted hydrolase